MVALRAGSATDVGNVRSNNQDSLLMADPLFAVADGMGGAAAGEVASSLAVEALGNGFAHTGPPTADTLVMAAQAANRAVWEEAEANPEMRGMGTTLVAVALVEDSGQSDRSTHQLAIINIGDSRLYVLRGDELRQITYDHNLVAEMVAEGRLTPEEAEVHPRRNIMTRALGVEPDVPVDLFIEEPVVGDRYLLCSDGLPREVSDDLIGSLLRRLADPAEAARELVEEAKRRGGNDNITVVVVDVVDDDVDDDDRLGGAEAVAADPVDLPDATRAIVSPAAADQTMAIPVVRAGDTGEPGPAATEEAAAPAKRPRLPTRRVITVRVVLFVLLLLIILGAAAAGIVWYARATYYVGIRGKQIVIYQGRPGGVLGIDPTLREVTRYTTAQILPASVPALESGQEEASLAAANSYVSSLYSAWLTAEQADNPATPSPSSTEAALNTSPSSHPTTTTVP